MKKGGCERFGLKGTSWFLLGGRDKIAAFNNFQVWSNNARVEMINVFVLICNCKSDLICF